MAVEYEAHIVDIKADKYLIHIRHGELTHVDYPDNMKVLEEIKYGMAAPSDEAALKTWIGAKVQALKDGEATETLSPSVVGNTYSETDLSVT